MTKVSPAPVYRYMYSHVGPISTIDSFALYGWQAGIKMLLRYYFDFSAFDLVSFKMKSFIFLKNYVPNPASFLFIFVLFT